MNEWRDDLRDLHRFYELMAECERAHADFDYWLWWGWVSIMVTVIGVIVTAVLGALQSPFYDIMIFITGICLLVMLVLAIPRARALERSGKLIAEMQAILDRRM
jgi:Flp pilus assembly protein TadB